MATEAQNTSQTWKQAFTYDRYGNRNFDEAETTTLPKNCGTSPNFAVCAADKKMVNPAVNTANNRLSTTDGYAFDSSGNTIGDAEGRTFVYDAENKQVSVSDANGTVGEYYYDGDGKRVKKYVPATGEVTVFVYDAGGTLIGEYSTVVQTGTDAKTVYPTNDHLGSPRINTDGIGQVISRHDYHPFGEEIPRTGYGSDTVRKQFTGYERDGETGLDFAQARYHSPLLGRFMAADPLLSSGRPETPQSWNRYTYAFNNPTNLVDPLGLYVCRASKSECEQFDAALEKQRANLAKIGEVYGKESKEYEKAERALGVYGEKGVNNGIYVESREGPGSARTQINGTAVSKTKDNPNGQLILVSFDPDMFSKDTFGNLIGHEGSHAADGSDWIKSGFKNSANPTDYKTESDAFTVQSLLAEASGQRISKVNTEAEQPYTRYILPSVIWNSSWEKADVPTLRQAGIDRHLKWDKDYKLTSKSKDPAFDRSSRVRWR